ncbi:MAG: hypothetical protein ACLVK4_14740 [Alistipes shahii]|uniref:hypothetical protein n=1 Tax=Alistipes shahii TaxID=328814 RepID=UPI00399CAD29
MSDTYQRRFKTKLDCFRYKHTHFIPQILFLRFSRISGIAEAAISSLFQISAPILQRKPGRVHIFCIFVRRVPEKRTNRKSDDEKLPILLLLLAACWSPAAAREPQPRTVQPQTEIITADSTYELIEQLRNMPNIEVGKGITFRPKKQLVRTDDAFPDAEPAVAVVRRRFHSPRPTPA